MSRFTDRALCSDPRDTEVELDWEAEDARRREQTEPEPPDCLYDTDPEASFTEAQLKARVAHLELRLEQIYEYACWMHGRLPRPDRLGFLVPLSGIVALSSEAAR